MDITEFLKARITEDETEAKEYQRYEDEVYEAAGWFNCTRVLAECAAKREIIEEHYSRMEEGQQGCVLCGHYTLDYGWEETGPCKTVRALAAVYKAHPDYQPEWAKTSQDTPKNT